MLSLSNSKSIGIVSFVQCLEWVLICGFKRCICARQLSNTYITSNGHAYLHLSIYACGCGSYIYIVCRDDLYIWCIFFESSMVHCSMDDMTTLQMIGSIECTMIAS
jgi:hypothetical protein